MSQHEPKPTWMDEEEERATDQTKAGETRPNPEAPQLVRAVAKAPPRMQKGLYIQEKYAHAFDQLVVDQKRAKGPKATALAEEMIKDILVKYGMDVGEL